MFVVIAIQLLFSRGCIGSTIKHDQLLPLAGQMNLRNIILKNELHTHPGNINNNNATKKMYGDFAG